MKRMVTLLAGALLMMGTTAQALTLTMSSGAETVVVNDNVAGQDLNFLIANSILWSGTVNGINVSFASGHSTLNPSLGTFDIGSLVVNGKGNLTIQLSETGLALNTLALTPNIVIRQSLSNSSFATGSTVSSDVRINGVSVPGIAASLVGGGYIETDGVATVGATFSMDEIVNIGLGTLGSSVSLDSMVNVAPVPEPGTMMLLGAGFLGLAIYGKRRKNA